MDQSQKSDAPENKSSKKVSDKEILRVARERFKLAEEAENDMRTEGLDDLKFRSGDQWPDQIKRERDQDGRPTIVINRSPQFIRQITNDQRQNRPQIKIAPTDDKGTVDTAKVIQGLIRHIEYDSNADIAYDTGFEGAATKGWGYWRIITEYSDPASFDQDIKIKPIKNSFTVYFDPNASEPDGSDAKFAFVIDQLEKDEYKELYPDSDLSDMGDWESIGASLAGWVTKSTARIAEYFYIEYRDDNVCLLKDGNIILESELAKDFDHETHIEKKRATRVPIVKWVKLNGIEILERTEWLGKFIPIVPIYGDELNIDGKKILEGVIRHAKDPQRVYNYMVSTETETIALAPKAPFIVAEGQITPEFDSIWKSANRKTHAYLPYKPISIGGVPVGAPTRNVYEANIQAITQARMQAADDLKATTGIYDSALGSSPNDASGIAIQRRNHQSQTSNFHFIDNLTRSLRHTGRILIDLIPKIYDTKRAVRILGDDGEQEIVTINDIFQHKGKAVNYDLGIGKYDVTVATGPSYATKRQEAVASMMDLTRSYPQIAQYAGDLMVKNMDWPGAQEIAERLKKTLPPGLADDPKNQQPIPPQAQAQIQQMGQQIDQLTQHLNAAADEIKTQKFSLESKERIAGMQAQVELEIAAMKIAPSQAMQVVLDELAHIKTRMHLVGIDDPVGQLQAQQQQMQAQQGPLPTQAPAQPNQNQNPTGGSSPGSAQADPSMGG